MTAALPRPDDLADDLADDARPTAREVWRGWSPHLLALGIPGNALLFVLTGPHLWWTALLFMLPLIVAHYWDTHGPSQTLRPRETMPAWPFDALVYGLAGIQLANVTLFVQLFGANSILSFDFLIGLVVVGAGSGHSIITAHELIHRSRVWEQTLGRFVLCSVLYEHFFTEHLRGHHLRVGTPGDPATARFGETFQQFYLRTVPAQFKSAWSLEKRRLGDASMSNLDPRMLRHRCLHGLVVGWGAVLAAGIAFGPWAVPAFILQGLFASRLLEIVNYFEHWGLTRESQGIRPIDSWDTHSWFTYYALIGLSRHADHHAHGSRPYQQLRTFEETALLPTGYAGMIPLSAISNKRFQRLMTAELERKGLGPFANRAAPEAR